MFAPLLATALALLASPPQDGTYRAAFDAGLAALAAGLEGEAAEHFRAAGEFAPDAPLWRAYLAHAEGGEPEAAPSPPEGDSGPWKVVPRSEQYNIVLDPTGERVLCGSGVPTLLSGAPTLWDAHSGERIAVLSHRSSETARFWRFDETGRLLIGIGGGWGPHSGGLRGLDVRDARTGDLIEVPGTTDLGMTQHMRFEWLPPGAPECDLQLGQVIDLPYADGILRCQFLPAAPYEEFVLRPDHRRVLSLEHHSPMEFQLMDPVSGETLAQVRPSGERAFFSPSGSFAICTSWFTPEIFLFDAETGERLPSPPLPTQREEDVWAAAFDGELLVIVERRGEVLYWDPRAGSEVRRLQLDPPPRTGVRQAVMADGGRCLIVHSYGWSRGYDTSTGEERWVIENGVQTFGEGLAPDGVRLLTSDGKYEPTIFDVRIGEVSGGYSAHSILATRDVMALEGTDAALLTVADGSLRRVEIASGATTALAEEHATTETVHTRVLDKERLVSWVEGERLLLRDATSLEPLHSIALEPDSRVLAIAPDGSQVVVRTPEDLLQVRTLDERSETHRIRINREHPLSAAFSPSGARWAVAYEGQVHLFETATRERVSVFSMRGGKIRNPDPMCFYGEDKLALAWGGPNRGKLGVHLYQLPGGERIAELTPKLTLISGGRISDLRCDPDIGRITYALVSTGYVASFQEPDWSECWNVDYYGGNGGSLILNRPADSGRMYVSGMFYRNARAMDLITGEVLAGEALDCLNLGATFGDRFVIGTRMLSLVVFEGEQFKELYQRIDGPNGGAWVVRDGIQRQAGGAAAVLPDLRHLTRGQVSRPIDCWAAWFLDPLELAPMSLDALPTPPRIVSGPPRLLRHLGDTVELELEVADGSALLGIELEIVGGEARFVPVALETKETSNPMKVTFSGPWPAEVRLRAVDRSGVRSAPWRVRLAHLVETPRER